MGYTDDDIKEIVDRGTPESHVVVTDLWIKKEIYDHKPKRKINWLLVLSVFGFCWFIIANLILIFWR